MTKVVRRAPVTALLALIVAAISALGTAPPAHAAGLPIHWTVDASTHIKSLDMDVDVPPGTFDGEIDLATGNLTGNLVLPPAQKSIDLFGLPLASTTFAMSQAAPITGHVDISTMTVSVTTSFNIRIARASLAIAPWLNLVGSNCRGVSPVSVTMTGPVNLTAASTFTSTYTIPKFTGCGFLVTPIINAIIPGPGNTFTATFGPA